MLRENRAAVSLFLQVQSQWRRAGEIGLMTSLDYTAVEAATRMLDIKVDSTLFGKLQVMEFAVLEAVRK